MKSLSVITTCKSRLNHLKQTLPLMLARPGVEVIVIDYGCPQGTQAWVQAHYPQVKTARIDDDPLFNHARARNHGLAMASSEQVAFIDADICLSDAWWKWWDGLEPQRRTVYRCAQDTPDRGIWGSWMGQKEDLLAVEGYDEMFRGWGGEDDDLYQRLDSIGCRFEEFPSGALTSIPHSDADRTRHQPMVRLLHSFTLARYYRTAKAEAMAFFRAKGELPLTIRQQIDRQIRPAFEPFVSGRENRPPSITLKLQAREGLTEKWHLAKQCTLVLEPVDITDRPTPPANAGRAG